MKLSAVLKAITPFLATDKKPEDVLAAVMAADKGKDAMPGNVASSKPIEDKAAKDRKAVHDKARDKMSDEDKKAFDAMSDEEKDKAAEDRDDDPEGTNDEEIEGEDEGDPTTPGGNRADGKTAIDSATVSKMIAQAVGARDALHKALVDVEPILGKVTFDSAGKAYRAALDHLKVDYTGIPTSGLPAMLRLAKDRASATGTPAMDSAVVSSLEKLIPGYGRLR